MEDMMAKALADLEAPLKAAHAAEIDRLMAEIARLRDENARMKEELDRVGKMNFKYKIVRKDLTEALEMPVTKTVGRMIEIIEDLNKFQAEAEAEEERRAKAGF